MSRRRVKTSISYRCLEDFLKLPEGMHIVRTFEDNKRIDDALSIIIEDDAEHRLPETHEGEMYMEVPIVFRHNEDGTTENITWEEEEAKFQRRNQDFEL